MAFDGIVLNCVVSELCNSLLNSKVAKIFQPSKTELIFNFYCHGENLTLLINVQPETARIHLTSHTKPNPIQAPNFCMLLRKHLLGAKLITINTFDLERIVEFVFETYNELKDKTTKKLVVQTMASHSNVILTNYSNTIIDSLYHISNSSFEIMPARTYNIPENSKLSFRKLKDCFEFLQYIPRESEETVDKILSDSFFGISRSFCQNLIPISSMPAKFLKESDYFMIYDKITKVLDYIPKLSLELTPNQKDYMVCFKSKRTHEVNYFLDDYYTKLEVEHSFIKKRNQLLTTLFSQLKKYTKRLENINLKLKECENMEQYRIYGELIISNLHRFPAHSNLENIIVENYYDNQKKIVIPLTNSYSLSKNAEKYFKKYNKLKNTLKVVTLQKKETEVELEYIQSILFSIENSSTLQELEDISIEIEESKLFDLKHITNTATNKKAKIETQSKPIELQIDGHSILVGKNNRQNDLLTFKIAKKQDIWFHVKNIQGSHVILSLNQKPITNYIILKCATIAAQHSKAKNSTHVCVDYCPVKNVKKIPGGKPGMVVYSNYKTIVVNLEQK